MVTITPFDDMAPQSKGCAFYRGTLNACPHCSVSRPLPQFSTISTFIDMQPAESVCPFSTMLALDFVPQFRVHIYRALEHRHHPVGGHDHAARSPPHRSAQRRHARAHRLGWQDRPLLQGTNRPDAGQHEHPRGTLRPPHTAARHRLRLHVAPILLRQPHRSPPGDRGRPRAQTAGAPPSKRTQEVAALIIRTRCETAGHMYEIAATLTPRGGPGRARLVGQVLTAYGLAQKNG